MTFKNYRQQSRDVQWGNEGSANSLEQINCGSLLRIADATEKMALRYTELIDKVARLERSDTFLRTYNAQQQRTISALKGQITKLKRKALTP